MTRRWVHSVDVEIEADGRASFDRAIADLAAALAPAANAPLGSKTADTTNWDNDSGEFDLTNGGAITPQFAHVYCAEDTWIVADTSDTDPTAGAVYTGGLTHVVPCRGKTRLHYKAVSANGRVDVTVFGN